MRAEPILSILYWHFYTIAWILQGKKNFAVLHHFLLSSQNDQTFCAAAASKHHSGVTQRTQGQLAVLLITLMHSPRPCPQHVLTASTSSSKAGCCMKRGTQHEALFLAHFVLGDQTSGILMQDPVPRAAGCSVACSSHPGAAGSSPFSSGVCGQYLL